MRIVFIILSLVGFIACSQNIYISPTEKEQIVTRDGEIFASDKNAYDSTKWNEENNCLVDKASCRYETGKIIGEKGTVKIYDMVLDTKRNIYLAGTFLKEEVLFDQSVYGETESAFIAKINADDTISWIRITSVGVARPHRMTISQSGNLFVLIGYKEKFSFGGFNIEISKNYKDYEGWHYTLNKIDPKGKVIWVKNIQGPGGIKPGDIKSLDNKIYVSMTFLSHINIEGQIFETQELSSGILAISFNESGNIVKIMLVAEMDLLTKRSPLTISSLVNSGDSTYISFFITGKSIICNQRFPRENVGSTFIVKYDKNNLCTIFKTMKSDSHKKLHMTLDAKDNFIIAGGFGEYIELDDMKIYTKDIKPKGFIAKISSSGNSMWIKKNGAFTVRSVFYDKSSDTGYIGGEVALELSEFGEKSIKLNGIHNIYVAKFDKDGHFLWVEGKGKITFLSKLAVSDNIIYVVGFFEDEIIFQNKKYSTDPNSDEIKGFLWSFHP